MIVILTKKESLNLSNDCIVINDVITFNSDYSFLLNHHEIFFDYLIIEDLTLVKNLAITGVLLDDNIPVTNWVGATSIAQIYYGDIAIALNDIMEMEEEK